MNSVSKYLFFLSFIWIFSFSCRTKNESGGKRQYEDFFSIINLYENNNWIGNPVGFFNINGEYHMFYSINSNDIIKNRYWGHVKSKDLLNWEKLHDPFQPDSSVNLLNGCIIADIKNTSNLSATNNFPLIAYYLNHHEDCIDSLNEESNYISLAYSLDFGRTWEGIQDDTVIPLLDSYARPKVYWYDEFDSWIMVLCLKDRIEFYVSNNCIDWEILSTINNFNNNTWESAELLAVESKEISNTKWLLLVTESNGPLWGRTTTKYFVGDFDGKNFKIIQNATQDFEFLLDYGLDSPSFIACSNEYRNRNIIIGFLSHNSYRNESLKLAQNRTIIFPRELSLFKDDFHYLLRSVPVGGIEKAYGNKQSIEEITLSTDEVVRVETNNKLTEIELAFDLSSKDWIGFPTSFGIQFKNRDNEYFIIEYENDFRSFNIKRNRSYQNEFDAIYNSQYYINYLPKNTMFKWRIIISEFSVELFVDDYNLALTNTILPENPFSTIELFSKGGLITINELQVTDLSFN